MTSTVACIGFTDPSALASIVREGGTPFHDLSSTTQWSDPSGAMLLLDRASQQARPGFRTEVRTPYTNLVALESGATKVFLTDVAGNELDALTVVPAARYTVGWAASGRAALVALGLDTEFFPTAEDFFDSPRSALPGFDSEPPPEVRQFGLPWPPPMELESFLPHESNAMATLSGTVQFAEVRTNTQTGHEFLVARISTLFGEIDLCTPVPVEGAPAPGSIAVATVEVLATLPAHGSSDDDAYSPPEEPVPPTFRDAASAGAGSEADIVLDPSDVALPEGLVLGDDGAVRTQAEHDAWKRESSATPSPADEAQQTASPTPSALPEARADSLSDAPPEALSDHQPQADDDAPRPGETRREWRARTGRA